MKQLLAILKLLPRKTLAVMFACLFMLQCMGVFHAAMAYNNTQLQQISSVVSVGDKADASAKSNHCDKALNDAGPMEGHCSHVGFCPLCSLAGLKPELLAKSSDANVIEVISLRRLAQAPIVEEIDAALLHLSVGVERTYYIIAPPAA